MLSLFQMSQYQQKHRVELYSLINMYIKNKSKNPYMEAWLSTLIPACILDNLNVCP